MRLTLRLFAGLRDRAGASSLDVELPDGARVADLLGALDGTPIGGLPERSFIVAVNREYAGPEVAIAPGDEVALIPPVSGGSDSPVRVCRLSRAPIDPAPLLAAVRDPRSGAVVLFEGMTREVPELFYEAYEEMAVERMSAIAEEECRRHGLCAAAVEHRLGAVPLSEASVLVAVSAPHRGEAFAGARAIMDRIKAESPVFKREDGDWVGELPVP